MINIQVIKSKEGQWIGKYRSPVVPQRGDRIDANNGHWEVILVQHEILADLVPTQVSNDSPVFEQSSVIVYVEKR